MFKKAVKGTRKFRIALDGPTGAGKTYSALAIACALSKKVCLIDTERSSGSLYADKFDFDTCDLANHDPRKYIETIKAAVKAGYDVIIIDSLSHAWMGKDGALEQVDKAAKRSQSNNTFAAWRDVTPLHNELVDTIVSADAHIIVTMRTKMEYVLEDVVRNGKTIKQPKKIGLAPIQRDGVEYEFDIVADINLEHDLIVSKTRLDNLDGLVMNKPGQNFVDLLNEWLKTAKDVPPAHLETKPVEEAQQGAVSVPSDREENYIQPPAPPSADDDDQILDDESWQKIYVLGDSKGWNKAHIYAHIHKEYGVFGGNFKQNVSKRMGREVYKHIASGAKPGAKAS